MFPLGMNILALGLSAFSPLCVHVGKKSGFLANWAPHFLQKQGSMQTKLGPTLSTCGLKNRVLGKLNWAQHFLKNRQITIH